MASVAMAINPVPSLELLRASLVIAKAEGWPPEEIQVLKQAIRDTLSGNSMPRPESAAAFLERDYPPPSWHVEGLIPANTIGAIAGPSFSGKTLVAIHAAALATTKGKRVTYVLEEGTAQDFKARLQAASVVPANLQVMFQAGARIDSPEWVEHWMDVLDGQDIAFFDTFSDVTAVDQLDSKSMLSIFKAVRAIRVATGCSICLLMHSPKAVFRGDTPPSLADVFGSVVAVNAMDFVHIIRTLKDDDEDVEGAVEVHCRKLRAAGSKPPPPRAGTILEHDLGGGTTTVSFRFTEGVGPREAKLQARTTKYRERVLDFIATNKVSSVTQVAEQMGGKTANVKQAVKDLLSIGRVTLGVDGFFAVVPGRSQAVPLNHGNGVGPASVPVPFRVPIRHEGNGERVPRPHTWNGGDFPRSVPDDEGTGGDES